MSEKQQLTLLKIGGRTIDDQVSQAKILHAFASLPEAKILVHGGGHQTGEWCRRLGIPVKMHNGRRITDEDTLQVVTMLYAGWINKSIVAKLQALDCNAIGLSGADGNIIQAHKRPRGLIDFGFAGDIDTINHQVLEKIIYAGLTPVCCAITHDKNGQLLNTNADTIAATLAANLTQQFEVRLWLCMDLPGVMLDPKDQDSLIPILDPIRYKNLIERGIIAGGMIPKVDNAFYAMQNGVHQAFIGNIDSLLDGTATQINPDVR